jgi:hypothetical protein
MTNEALRGATKDQLVLGMLAVLGGDRTEVNERDLFLACWHAFPNTMRWVDTALPNPDTFTASLRRLDQRGYVERQNKQQRKGRGRPRRKTSLDAPGRAGVVKTRIVAGALELAGIGQDLVEAVRQLRPDAYRSSALSDARALATCVRMREQIDRSVDEGALVELAFHRFPDRFAYTERPEFPDVERIRLSIRSAQSEGLLDGNLRLTDAGRQAIADDFAATEVRADESRAQEVGDIRFAARIERSPAYLAYAEQGTLVKAKPDELFRALRIPPTTDPKPVADALRSRVQAFRRIDKGEVADYLLEVAARHNEDAFKLLDLTPNGARETESRRDI